MKKSQSQSENEGKSVFLVLTGPRSEEGANYEVYQEFDTALEVLKYFRKELSDAGSVDNLEYTLIKTSRQEAEKLFEKKIDKMGVEKKFIDIKKIKTGKYFNLNERLLKTFEGEFKEKNTDEKVVLKAINPTLFNPKVQSHDAHTNASNDVMGILQMSPENNIEAKKYIKTAYDRRKDPSISKKINKDYLAKAVTLTDASSVAHVLGSRLAAQLTSKQLADYYYKHRGEKIFLEFMQKGCIHPNASLLELAKDPEALKVIQSSTILTYFFEVQKKKRPSSDSPQHQRVITKEKILNFLARDPTCLDEEKVYVKVAYEYRKDNDIFSAINSKWLLSAARQSVSSALMILESRLATKLEPEQLIDIYAAHASNKNFIALSMKSLLSGKLPLFSTLVILIESVKKKNKNFSVTELLNKNPYLLVILKTQIEIIKPKTKNDFRAQEKAMEPKFQKELKELKKLDIVDPFQFLGLKKNVNTEDIKERCKGLLFENHPDRKIGDNDNGDREEFCKKLIILRNMLLNNPGFITFLRKLGEKDERPSEKIDETNHFNS